MTIASPQTWHPIETAPKDEKRVLLFNPDEGNFGWGVQSGAYYEQLGGWQYDGQMPRYSNAHHPTHWMPLPPPPEATPQPDSAKAQQLLRKWIDEDAKLPPEATSAPSETEP